MKSILVASLIAAIGAGSALAQQAEIGGQTMVYSTKGSSKLQDTTADLGNSTGGQVHTSTDNNDGKTPNGGAGTGGESKPREK